MYSALWLLFRFSLFSDFAISLGMWRSVNLFLHILYKTCVSWIWIFWYFFNFRKIWVILSSNMVYALFILCWPLETYWSFLVYSQAFIYFSCFSSIFLLLPVLYFCSLIDLNFCLNFCFSVSEVAIIVVFILFISFTNLLLFLPIF